MDEQNQISSNMLSRLNSLQQRSKTKNLRPPIQSITPSSTDSKVELEEPKYQDAEVATEEVAQRIKDDESFAKAQDMAQSLIPKNPITLRVNTQFTPENMYEQVKNDYIGMIRQSVNSALDKLTLFYMRNNRFKEPKDMKHFLLSSLQEDISDLKKQYIAKYPLINGLAEVIKNVEVKEAATFKSIVDEFITRMTGNTFNA
jgi:hypothetical protein